MKSLVFSFLLIFHLCQPKLMRVRHVYKTLGSRKITIVLYLHNYSLTHSVLKICPCHGNVELAWRLYTYAIIDSLSMKILES